MNPFEGSGSEEDEGDEDKPLEERMAELVELIKAVVEPDSWEPEGENTIRAWKTNIIIRAPIEVHEIIGGPFILPD